MSFKNRHATIGLLIVIIMFLFIDSFVVIRFFTDDKLEEVTISQASLINSEETISLQLAKLENPETIFIENTKISEKVQDVSKNTNEITSRSATERKTNTTASKQTSIGTIEIPKTNVNLPIFKDVTLNGMETGTCFLYSTGSLNKSGTTIIVGHNYCNGKLFSNNNKLTIGDKIYIITSKETKVKYTIYDKFITTEEDISYLEKNKTNKPEIALSTCTDDEQNRLVILAN